MEAITVSSTPALINPKTFANATLVDLVEELLHRQKTITGTDRKDPIPSRFEEVGMEDLIATVLASLALDAQKPTLQLSHGTTLACTNCGRLNAPAFYLKRSHGRYAVLCFDHGQGCWERSARSMCSYVDQHQAQCPDLAEYAVAYGKDKLKERHVCALHVPAVLSDAEHFVYPLQD